MTSCSIQAPQPAQYHAFWLLDNCWYPVPGAHLMVCGVQGMHVLVDTGTGTGTLVPGSYNVYQGGRAGEEK